MSEPKAIHLGCFCFECEGEDGGNNPAKTASKSGSQAIDREDEKKNNSAARKSAGALECLLFGA
ncbi:MAG TPA: hypothetical protein VGC14_21840 [Rhizobium sp.]